ncbi:hypothetical protein EAY82_18350, partial [Vibrio anguillarum]|nr:hypothetical protein [Vibrio anguillarum]
ADQSIMSEGLTQSHCTINIETLPRITPKPTRFIFMSMQCLLISIKFKYLSVCLCCVTLH